MFTINPIYYLLIHNLLHSGKIQHHTCSEVWSPVYCYFKGIVMTLNPRVSISQTVSAPGDRSRTARPLGSDTGWRSSRSSDERYERSCQPGSASGGGLF